MNEDADRIKVELLAYIEKYSNRIPSFQRDILAAAAGCLLLHSIAGDCDPYEEMFS